MRYIIKYVLPLISILILLTSCDNKEADNDKGFTGENAGATSYVLTLDEIRIQSVVLKWEPQNDDIIEYAIAAIVSETDSDTISGTDSFEDILANGYIISGFDVKKPTNKYKATGLKPGKTYNMLLFGRKKNGDIQLLTTENITLSNISEAGFVSVRADGTTLKSDFPDDKYTAVYLYGTEKESCTFSYRPYKDCIVLYNGVSSESGEITVAPGENVTLTVVNESSGAARDFIFAYEPMDNGLPVVFIDVEGGKGITDRENYLYAVMKITDSKKNPTGYDTPEFIMQIKGRGNSSFGMPKKSYTIEFRDDMPILGMEASNDWMLGANYADKSLMRNHIAYELYRDMDAEFSPETKFVDLVLNGNYVGTYTFGERIKVDKGRLDFPKIKPYSTSGGDVTGTYVLEVNSADKYDATEVIFETTRINRKSDHFYSIKQPPEKYLSEQAVEYITEYVNDAEDALFSGNYKDAEKGFRAYIDEASVIDWYLVNELFKNVDSTFHTSVYFYKPQGGKLHMGPVWDFDIGAGNIDYAGCDNPEGWHVRNSAYMSRFFTDEQFVRNFRERWNYVKENCFDAMFTNIENTARLLTKSANANFEIWSILGTYTWPNAAGYADRKTYNSEVDYLITWLKLRIEWMDREINK